MVATQMYTILSAIRRKRETMCYTQEYMAARLKQSQNSYCKMELGHCKLTLAQLFLICDVFNVKVTEFIKPPVMVTSPPCPPGSMV